MSSAPCNSQPMIARWLKFNVVSAFGIAVQFTTLGVLTTVLHFHYIFATALAVEAAVIHNFLWHERYTWADRQTRAVMMRFITFNATNGALSIVGNLVMMKLLVEGAHLPYLPANGMAIAACSIANFFLSDRLVFRIGKHSAANVSDPGRTAKGKEAKSPLLSPSGRNRARRCHGSRSRIMPGQASYVATVRFFPGGQDVRRCTEPLRASTCTHG